MTGILNIDSFELFFEEKILQKGLLLFKKGKIKSADKTAGGNYVFLFKGKHETELDLQKKGNKILNFSCTCKKAKCEHFASALFYLNKDKLDIENVTEEKPGKKRGEILFKQYGNKLKALMKRRSLDFRNSKEIERTAFDIARSFLLANKKEDQVILHLSILNEFSSIFSLKKSINREISENVLKLSVDFLNGIKPASLSEIQKETWMVASKNSLSNDRKFSSGIYTILIPFVTIFCEDITELNEIKGLLGKRNIKFNYPGNIDDKLVAYLELIIAAQKFKENKNEIRSYESTVEFIIARAQMEFYKGKKVKAFKLLLEGRETIKDKKPANFIAFVEYTIQKAKQLGDKETEASFLKQLFIYDYLITPNYLERIKEILPENKRKELIDEVIAALKLRTNLDNFEKIVQILESENRPDELVREISKQSNKFGLLNKTAIKKLPEFDNFLLSNYVKHFISALSDARETYHQKEIFESAKVYFDQLPKNVTEKLVGQLLEKISKSDFIYKLLQKYLESLH